MEREIVSERRSKKKQIFIFDFDGTLISGLPSIKSINNALSDRFSRFAGLDELLQFDHLLKLDYTEKPQVNPGCLVSPFAHLATFLFKKYSSLQNVNETLRNVLKENNGKYDMAILSARRRKYLDKFTQESLEKYNLKEFFDDNVYLKPDRFKPLEWKIFNLIKATEEYDKVELFENDIWAALTIREFAKRHNLNIHMTLVPSLETADWVLKLVGANEEEISDHITILRDPQQLEAILGVIPSNADPTT